MPLISILLLFLIIALVFGAFGGIINAAFSLPVGIILFIILLVLILR